MHKCQVFKVSFMPLLGRDRDGSVTTVGRWMVFVSAHSANEIASVLQAFLPELADESFDVEDSVTVRPENKIWSVSVGPPGRSHSMLVEAPDEERAMQSLVAATLNMPLFRKHVEMKMFVSRLIDLSKPGVW